MLSWPAVLVRHSGGSQARSARPTQSHTTCWPIAIIETHIGSTSGATAAASHMPERHLIRFQKVRQRTLTVLSTCGRLCRTACWVTGLTVGLPPVPLQHPAAAPELQLQPACSVCSCHAAAAQPKKPSCCRSFVQLLRLSPALHCTAYGLGPGCSTDSSTSFAEGAQQQNMKPRPEPLLDSLSRCAHTHSRRMGTRT
jgi:hypothetical protein